ncbi:hypothetical protein F9B85_13925 [Heliorestis acidaminivorans]|uniref:Core-binding (CB) domain-containing protein n=1 Tax=Heliorestis acidaminivorans TaxID=553427 RepID=A0A6I0EVM2_9FIRM|nr:phage integrase N-terminal SAM-like domain-containing protein [Heliorestis acidaminivorans]KAB2950792.1 hypothetical protein F9B85_13925 [Heliorestis acidaminivorans]
MIDDFIKHLERQGKVIKAQNAYRNSWTRFTEWLAKENPHPTPLGGLPDPQMATQLDVANFKRYAVRHYKPNTVNLTMTHLNVIFRWFMQKGVIPDNPVEHVDRVPTPQSSPKWLTGPEQNLLVRTVRKYGDVREMAMIMLMMQAGLGLAV